VSVGGRGQGGPPDGDQHVGTGGAGASPGRPAAPRRHGEPRRLGDVLDTTLTGLARSEQARAYAAWALAAGQQVAGTTRPRAFQRGQLTVECESSVWAHELTFLGGRILRRMDEVAEGHPVKRLRFVVAPRPAQPVDDAEEAPAAAPRERPSYGELESARTNAEGVRDERLRAAIDALIGGLPAEADHGPVKPPGDT
jgi:hypothetical protein